MVYRLKRTFRKKRPVNRRRFNMVRRKTRKPMSGQIKIVRWSSKDATNNCHKQLTGNDALPALDGSDVFALNDVNGSTELQSLFDNYRVLKVLYRWVCIRDPSVAPTTSGNKGIYPRIVWKHDFNDQVVISRTQMYQNANIKEVYFTDNYSKTKWYTLNPAVDMTIYVSAIASAYSPKWRQWLDTQYNAVPHYGIKYCYSDLYSGMYLRLEAKLIFECKGIS